MDRLPAKNAKKRRMVAELLYKEESYKIIGCCFEVYKQKGCGFNEAVYQECLAIEFGLHGIPFVSQPAYELEYKGKKLGQFFKPDFVCYGQIVVELKAMERLIDVCRAQVINYLNASNLDLGILMNFGHFPKLEYERIANSRNRGTRPTMYSRLANKLEEFE